MYRGGYPTYAFTNTLSIDRLQLGNDEKQQIKVIYLDLLQQEIKSVYQNYTRVSDAECHYENVPNDFEATIRIDEEGFVINYPELFTRTAKQSLNRK
ncbi:putative glycolipid-binding domain-containing protein [Pedobacter sp. CCM 8938]|uniref:Glycolipid-binding domain-containing protein n=1 Tax=Pedobacter fastidiosus TaxID=2765361 RepID=A0ABR7KY58_9SPHI|nr:putative glycolipid-binding domain-containing protein [Pedobacter fastidiosus]MBC6113012.1 putative glycolipid-binding domain-containing protein [Pedobacter fastidiosus]